MTADASNSRAGLQGTRHTRPLVTVYPLGQDPILTQQPKKLELLGRTNTPGEAPSITGVNCALSLAGHPVVTINIKAPHNTGGPDLLDQILDDDWFDLSFQVNGETSHVVRGQVDSFRRSVSAGGDGAPRQDYTLQARGFGAIFEKTFAWFNSFKEENALLELTLKLFGGKYGSGQSPKDTVSTILFGFLETLTGEGRPDWALPKSMPGVLDTFAQSIKFDGDDVDEDTRHSLSMQFSNPGGVSIWSFAQEWSDPMFGELICDLGYAGGGYLSPERAYGPEATAMTVFFRDKPFPTVAKGKDSLWFRLPMVSLPRQAIQRMDLGRSGAERINAVMAVPQVPNEEVRAVMTQPLWDPKDIAKHGMRQLAIQSRYMSDGDHIFLSAALRERARDYHALNAYLLSGNIALGALFPRIRPGMRFRITDTPDNQETYYVEQVSHAWSPESGGRTTLVVTRGWRGTDASYLTALDAAAARYRTVI